MVLSIQLKSIELDAYILGYYLLRKWWGKILKEVFSHCCSMKICPGGAAREPDLRTGGKEAAGGDWARDDGADGRLDGSEAGDDAQTPAPAQRSHQRQLVQQLVRQAAQAGAGPVGLPARWERDQWWLTADCTRWKQRWKRRWINVQPQPERHQT